MDALDNFYTDQSFVDIDIRQRETKDILNISVFGLGDFINFKNTTSHNCLVQKSKNLCMARSEILTILLFIGVLQCLT